MPTRWAYFDTSVLVKRYVRERGTARARSLLRRYRFLSSAVVPLEVKRMSLRTLDAVHVASALAFETASGIRIPFVTADGRQRDAAGQVALNVVWVE